MQSVTPGDTRSDQGLTGSDASPSAGRDVLVLSGSTIRSILSLDDVVPTVERAYVASARGEASLYPVVREALSNGAGVFGVKSGFWPARDALGLKVAGYWPANRPRGFDNHQALVVLLDPATGVARAILDGNVITFIRTAAAGAIGLHRLARPDAGSAVIVGAGVQGEAQARAIAWWRPAVAISVVEPLDDPTLTMARGFCRRLAGEGVSCTPGRSIEDAVRAADIVVTVTPARAPLVMRAWLRPGCHVNAMGADTKGKQEHEVATLQAARVVVDDWRQASELGECQHAVAAGVFEGRQPDSIGDVIAGRAPGRASDEELTLFDATGLALQDLAVADLAFRIATDRGLGMRVELD
jgi:ornithine cyclodeaminase